MEEWQAMRGLPEYRSIVIKPDGKGSSMVVWDKTNYSLGKIFK